MSDIIPAETPLWQFLEDVVSRILATYGYREIRLPILEKTALFSRSIGEDTDIVEKEMYTFADRNGDSLTMRPEGTAGCVRAVIEHGLLRGAAQRLWYAGPMFRHERPQQGRYRQFHQIGVETFGIPGPEIDAELLLMSARFWRALGLPELTLEINSLGTQTSRHAYRQCLVDYLQQHYNRLDENSRRRMKTNPLRVLDSKNPDMQELIGGAPRILDFISSESRAHFDTLQHILRDAGLDFSVNPRLVRGLDYYTDTVFEWVTDALGAQGTVCAGGRYDTLVAQLGVQPTPAAGFAMGLERLIALLSANSRTTEREQGTGVYLVAVGADACAAAHGIAEALRDHLPRLRLTVDAGPGSFKTKLKRADREGAVSALILGDEEIKTARIGIKRLREQVPQESIAQTQLGDYLQALLSPSPAGATVGEVAEKS